MKFSKGKVNLMLGDCMDLMESKPDNYYDLAVVDVNYGIDQGGEKNHTRGKKAISKNYKGYDDSKPPPPLYFDLLKRKSKNQIIWGANHFIDNFPFMANSSCWIVWNKLNGNTDFADCEIAWTSFKTAVRIFNFRWQGMLQGNMKDKQIRIHPSEKPVKLYDWIFHNYAKPEFKILDTHGGSMSSAIAAYYFGCEFDCIEKDPDYFNDAVKRFKAQTMQAKTDFSKKIEQNIIQKEIF